MHPRLDEVVLAVGRVAGVDADAVLARAVQGGVLVVLGGPGGCAQEQLAGGGADDGFGDLVPCRRGSGLGSRSAGCRVTVMVPVGALVEIRAQSFSVEMRPIGCGLVCASGSCRENVPSVTFTVRGPTQSSRDHFAPRSVIVATEATAA
ncbi:hypothetical protein [Streptomyces atratus]